MLYSGDAQISIESRKIYILINHIQCNAWNYSLSKVDSSNIYFKIYITNLDTILRYFSSIT
jgi:hypothetical protein